MAADFPYQSSIDKKILSWIMDFHQILQHKAL